MFSCCCSSSSPVSSLEKPRSSTLSRRLRCGLIPHPRRLWPFTRKKPKKPPQEIREEKEHGIIYSVYPKKGAKKGWRRLWCVCGLDQDLDETCVVRTVKAGSLEKLVEHLVPTFTEGDLSYIDIFLGTYRTFATTQQVLELLFQRYGYNCPHSAGDGGPQDQQKDAISFILKTWMDEYPEDFHQPAHLPCLKLLVEYLQVNMPGSDLEHRALLLCAQLDHLEPKEAEPEGLAPGLKAAQDLRPPTEGTPGRPHEADHAPIPTLEFRRASGPPSPHQSPHTEPAGMLASSPGSPPGANTEPRVEVDPTPEPSQELDGTPDPQPPPPLSDEEPAGGLGSLPGSPPEPAPVPPAGVHPAPVSTPELHTASAIPSPASTLAPEGKPPGGVDSHPGPPQEPDSGPPAGVDPAPAATVGINVAAVPPSAALTQAPDEGPNRKPDSNPGPSPELSHGPTAAVDPAPAATPGLNVAPGPPSPGLAQVPEEEAAGNLDHYPEAPQEQASRPPAEVHSIPIPTAELGVAPYVPSPGLAQALEEEAAGKVDLYPGPPTESAPGVPADVELTPAPTQGPQVAPCPPSAALAQAPEEQSDEKSDSYPEPPAETTPRPPVNVDPAPASTPGLK